MQLAASSNGRRVFPIPPGPATVTSRWARSNFPSSIWVRPAARWYSRKRSPKTAGRTLSGTCDTVCRPAPNAVLTLVRGRCGSYCQTAFAQCGPKPLEETKRESVTRCRGPSRARTFWLADTSFAQLRIVQDDGVLGSWWHHDVDPSFRRRVSSESLGTDTHNTPARPPRFDLTCKKAPSPARVIFCVTQSSAIPPRTLSCQKKPPDRPSQICCATTDVPQA